MSLWGFDGEDNPLTAWSSLSQFDDVVWNEFGETYGDHVVPNPNSPQNAWLANGDRRKRMHREPSLSVSTIKAESATSTGEANSASEMSSDIENRSKETLLLIRTTSPPASSSECRWTGPDTVDADLTESEPFSSDHPLVSRGTDDTGDEGGEDHRSPSTKEEDTQVYACEENASMSTDPFSISDIGSQDGGLEIFGSENVASKADTLLELGWENISNLDDMDKLFRNNDTSFEPVLASGTEGQGWPSASSPTVGDLDSGMEFEKASPVSETIAANSEVDELEDKTELVFDDCLPGLMMDTLDNVVADNGSPRPLNVSVGELAQQHPVPLEEDGVVTNEAKPNVETMLPKARPTEGTGLSKGSLPKAEKVEKACPAQAYRGRRHAPNRKRSEDRFKRTTAYRKLSPGPPYNIHLTDGRQLQTLPLRLPGQPPLLRPALPLQYFPQGVTPGMIGPPHQQPMSQGVPYIQVAYPVHHGPPISVCPSNPMMHMQHPQAMFIDNKQTVRQGQRQPPLAPQPSPSVTSWPLNTSNRPPPSSLYMTPQEKMEKLRWRQQMQARMAVEQQHQQLLAPQNRDRSDPSFQKKQMVVCPDQPRRPLKSTSDQAGNPIGDPLEANQRVLVKDGTVPPAIDKEEMDHSLEGSVLCQLKSTVSALDIGTRLCIRNALYRLARSAMKRRAGGSDNLNESQGSKEQDSDANQVESSTASGPPPSSGHSKATSMSVVETETNAIDRSIAKLLFSKPQPTMFGRPYAYS